ncbi:MAG: GIY-YIG nuclease family protein [Patescibacteria group bacterium]
MAIGEARVNYKNFKNNTLGIVYILQSEKNGKYYIGSTTDLNRRILEHNSGKTKSLKYLLPMRLLFQQSFENLIAARRMEIKLKKMKNRNIISQIIADGEIKMGR